MKIVFLGYNSNWPEKKQQIMEAAFPDHAVCGASWSGYFACLPLLWLLMHKYKPDVIVAQTVYHGLIALFVRPRTPLIVENHGDLPYRNKKVIQSVLKKAKAYRAVSRFTADQFFAYGLKYTPPIHIFPAWTDIDIFLDAYVKYKKPHEKIIVYAGEIAPHKGVQILFHAFQNEVLPRNPDAKLRIIGKVTDVRYMRQITMLRNTLGLPVTFEDPMPQEQLAKVITQADVVTVPSLREGFGRVALEAMACGTPVVVSYVGGLKEIISHAKNGYFAAPGDSYLLGFWLNYVLEYPEVAEILGISGRAKASELFSTEKYVGGYRGLIESVVKNND